ncbi:MAG TPA: ComEA family DNA-binding protein, partial [Candidatus Cybelea sp.]|nr:ComEA family DNA-binding protein [Candidatus Cybelea sp.]
VAAVAFAFHHPAPRSAIETAALPAAPASASPLADRRQAHRPRQPAQSGEVVVYVAGAVRRPGLYHLQFGDRYARAVELAGGLSPQADAAGVNLAAPAGDGDEIDVPATGQAATAHRQARRGRHRTQSPAEASVDINAADAAALGAVPGIGRAIAQRVVDLREREGPFSSADELLDVAGMTQSRLERARPYLRQP